MSRKFIARNLVWKIVVFVMGVDCGAFAQGTFQNLDFEQATPAQYSGFVSAAQAIPDWTAEIGEVPQTEILQNEFTTGAAAVALLSQNLPFFLNGSYSVFLTGNPLASASVSQTGEIPTEAQSLLFYAEPGSGPLAVTIGTDSLTLFPVGGGGGVELYGANISAWAGKTEQLTFSASVDETALNNWQIDNISFSPNPITVTPEPSTILLTALAAPLFAAYRSLSRTRFSNR